MSFGRDTKSRWSLLSGVYGRGSKRSHTGGKCVTCSGLTHSRELLHWPKFGLFGGNHVGTKDTTHHLLQAPYLVYVEVLRCENAHTAPVPGKILENTLRYTRSEEDLTSQYHDGAAAGQAGAGAGPVDTPPQRPEFSFYCAGGEFDDADCWSQEDDEIIQVGVTPM